MMRANAEAIYHPRRGAAGEETDLLIPAKSAYVWAAVSACEGRAWDLAQVRIVDIGCSRGDVLMALRELGAQHLVGVNFTPFNDTWLKDPARRREYWGDEPGKIRYLQCDVDASRLPFPDASQDVIFMTDVLEHLHNPGHALLESRRVLRDGGLLLIGTPNGANLKNRLYLMSGRSPYCDLRSFLETERIDGRFVGHIREYTLTEVSQLLGRCGFDVILRRFFPSEVVTRHGLAYSTFRLLERLYPPFAYHMLLIGQRMAAGDATEAAPNQSEV